jgi:hypothetical protein
MAKRSETTDCGSVADAMEATAKAERKAGGLYPDGSEAAWSCNRSATFLETYAAQVRALECRSVAETQWTSVAPAERTPGPLDALVDMDPEALRALVEEAVREAAPILEANKGVFDATVSGETLRRVIGGRRRPKVTKQESVPLTPYAGIDLVLRDLATLREDLLCDGDREKADRLEIAVDMLARHTEEKSDVTQKGTEHG